MQRNDTTDTPIADTTEPKTNTVPEDTRSRGSRPRYLATAASLVSAALGAKTLVASATEQLRRLDADDALAWLGLSRRRSPFALAGAFGAGAMVGAGVALLVTPVSGRQLRARLAARLTAEAPQKEGAEATEVAPDDDAPKTTAHQMAPMRGSQRGRRPAADNGG